MAAIADFIRRTPLASLREYFDHIRVALPADVTWDAPANDVVAPLLRAVDALDDVARQRILNDADRVGAMTDEPGQAALFAVARDAATLDSLPNGHARALWVFLNQPRAFDHAEEVRYADGNRYGRMWDGFQGPPAITVPRDGDRVAALERAIAERFDSLEAQIEVCDRIREALDEPDAALVQVTAYRQGRSGDMLAFVNGRVTRRPYRPVIEAVLTYEPITGTIEVVAAARETREDLVRLFAEHLLSTPFEGQRIPLRHYRLDHLRQPFDFPTLPGDGIESVRIAAMRLIPLDTQGRRITAESMRGSTETIWQMVADTLKYQEHGIEGYRITQVRFTIRFRPRPGVRGGRTLPVTITLPHGCNLKDRTERERLIGERYLRHWRILRDV